MPNPDTNDERKQAPEKDEDQTQSDRRKGGDHDEEMLDETIDESFPASDPPANY